MSSTTVGTHPGTSRSERGWGGRAALIALTWVVLCALVIGWGWLLTHPLQSSIDPKENSISRWFADQRTSSLSDLADLGTLLGETIVGASAFTVVCLVVAAVKRTWRPILLVAVVEAGLGLFYLVATTLITRDRPPVHILDAGLDPHASFPSGHTATSLVLFLGTFLLVRTYFPAARYVALVLLLFPLGTLLSRLYQGAHHLTDVLTSLVYATVWLLVVARQLLPAPAPRDT